MPDNEFSEKFRAMIKRTISKSKRNGSWFRLSSSERGLYFLSAKLNVKFTSIQLMRAIVSIMKKLKEIGDRFYNELIAGSRLAWIFSEAAVGWGNISAKAWRNDRNYILFLGKVFGYKT